jgi:hypothetical protein
MCRASVRSLEHRSRSFQSGPVGQSEYTNAAKGGGSHVLRNSTVELRGYLIEIKSSPAPRVVLRSHFQPALFRRHQGRRVPFLDRQYVLALARCNCFLPKLGCSARMAASAAQSHPVSPPSAVAA